MKQIFYIILLLGAIFKIVPAQNHASKEWTIIDPALYNKIDAQEKQQVDSLLTIYHKTPYDTTQLRILDAIIETIENNTIWPHYNTLMLQKAKHCLHDTSCITHYGLAYNKGI